MSAPTARPRAWSNDSAEGTTTIFIILRADSGYQKGADVLDFWTAVDQAIVD